MTSKPDEIRRSIPLAKMVTDAFNADMETEGCDIGAGLFGPKLTDLIVSLASRDFDPVMMSVIQERARQREKGYDGEYDARLDVGELASAAACYAVSARYDDLKIMGATLWPWVSREWKPSPDHRQNLLKAIALLMSEVAHHDAKEAGKCGSAC